MTTLQELQDAKDHESLLEDENDTYEHERAEELQGQQDSATTEQAKSVRVNGSSPDQKASSHRRSNSEVDYGIEKSHPTNAAASVSTANGTNPLPIPTPIPTTKSTSPSSQSRGGPRAQLSPPIHTPKDRRVRKNATGEVK